MSASDNQLLKIILAVILPPVGAFLHAGVSDKFFISLLLTLFGFLPGVVYTIYIILKA